MWSASKECPRHVFQNELAVSPHCHRIRTRSEVCLEFVFVCIVAIRRDFQHPPCPFVDWACHILFGITHVQYGHSVTCRER